MPLCRRLLLVPFKPTCSLFTEKDSTEKTLSVKISDFSSEVLIQRSVLDAIWSKATELINDPKAICMVPGGRQNSEE